MFASLKRLFSPRQASRDEGQALMAWAKAEHLTFKRVKDKSRGGFVVDSGQGWRVELGSSQRPYIAGKELRFRGETGVPGDVQMLVLTKVLAQNLESDVFQRYTNAMQTQIDNTLPDEMRWLAMHPRVSLPTGTVLAKRFVILCNAEVVARKWLEGPMMAVLDQAATGWWTDSLMLVLTMNRGMLTLRMAGDALEQAQLKAVSDLFNKMLLRMREVAREV